jgi:hypothetical protein
VLARAALGAACFLASFPACAHGGAVPAWVPTLFLIAFAGMLACIFVPPLVGSGSIWLRYAQGLGWAGADFLVWLALLWIFAGLGRGSTALPEFVGIAGVALLTLGPWILPVVLFVVGRRRVGR